MEHRTPGSGSQQWRPEAPALGMEHPEEAGDEVAFFTVPLAALQVNAILGFHLYIRAGEQDEITHYRDANLAFTQEHRKRLLGQKMTDIYITADDHGHYLSYLGDRLAAIVRDPSIPPAQRAALTYESMAHVMAGTLEDPRSSESIRCAQGTAHAAVDLLHSGTTGILDLFKLMSFDYSLHTHSVNVCLIGIALGQQLGLTRDELRELSSGLLLHDIGKTAIDAAILHKEGPLTDQEMTIMKTHPSLGLNLLRQIDAIGDDALAVVLQHHERMSGGGYPRGLSGDKIHTFAKIAILADVFDALTTCRSYKSALGSFPALREMQEEMPSSFEPCYFRQFISLFREPQAARSDMEEHQEPGAAGGATA
jgi:HD-GYP domain-containing protein (c-di-GMP phosphodiesterase class II)